MRFASGGILWLVIVHFGIKCATSVILYRQIEKSTTPTVSFPNFCGVFHGISSPFINVGSVSPLRVDARNELNFKHITSFISSVHIANKVKELLLEHGCIRNVLDVRRQSRLEYNRDLISETYASAIVTHNSFDTKRPLEVPDSCFYRFDGDHEDELSLGGSQSLGAHETLASIPVDFCHSLISSISHLFQNLGLLKLVAHDNPLLSKYVSHIDSLLNLSFGTHLNKESFKSIYKPHDSAKLPSVPSGDDGFEARLFDFLSLKRLQLLRLLILSDTLTSIDSSLSATLNISYIKIMSVNDNEKEMLLLGLALVGEYFINLLDFTLRYLHGKVPYSSAANVQDKIKILWLHYLINRDVSHLPTVMPDASVEQIQQHIIRYKVSRRKLATFDLFKLTTDPISVIQDHIEHIAQYHYKQEDSFPRKFGYGPLTSDRRIHIEELLCKIESELLSFNDSDMEISLFTLSKKDYNFVLNGSKAIDDTVMCSKNKDFSIKTILDLFLNHVLEESSSEDCHVSSHEFFMGLNSFVTLSLLNRFVSTLVSHVIRFEPFKPEQSDTNSSKYFHRSYLFDAAPGIACKLISSTLEKAADLCYDETNQSFRNYAYVVPLIDLCNHSFNTANSQISASFSDNLHSTEEKLTFQLSTTKNIEARDEIKINYGINDNNIFLLDYGFVSGDRDSNGVIIDIEPASIREAAYSQDIANLLPLAYPSGLPKEKTDFLKDMNLIKIPKIIDIMELYKDPQFEGLPIKKYCEFASKFIARENAKNDPRLDYDNTMPDCTLYRQPIPEPDEQPQNEDFTIPEYIKISGDGVPDPRLILLLKVSFCRNLKRLNWIKEQTIEYLATSVNSPLDVKTFKVAATLCRNYIGEHYGKTISDDLKLINDKDVCKLSLKYKDKTFQDIRYGTCLTVPNAIIISHCLRQKIPVYKCANFYNTLSESRNSLM
ncbi:conserved hypothetical protein [Theileria equi strain WA]|uniref:SET domain-containing protein n=1 Tax=Theileria equi strain WA TaxID=1537102 RepID=L1LBP0_THEEQ|nr:conserved hypothetical protein [Theileria equi strain WA]EKX72689.1 conserved hypothetical protein [Theileria equi strain WA]|eukprot:XP_004832141.1 conserved hypothetical protein [Theileria equi strain WA]